MTDDVTLHIPRSSIWGVFEVAYEYDFATLPDLERPRILDIGANCGIFAIAAVQRWAGAKVSCYEPHPVTCALCRGNVSGLPVEVHQAAVMGGGSGTVSLHEGSENRLCCSLYDIGRQDMGHAIAVKAVDAAELPACDVLKLDTEGCEVGIVEAYKHLGVVRVVLAEIHRTEDFGAFDRIALRAGLRMLDRRVNTMRYVR